MKNSFFTMMLGGAMAVASPTGVWAAEMARANGEHAVVRAAAARPLVERGYVYGRVRPRGYYVVPRFGFAYDPFWYGPGWGYYGYSYPYEVPIENTGGLRLEITPKTAQVFVDGYYAGVVDDFNGRFQHLDLKPGGHRIDVRQPGFQSLTIQTYIQPGHTTDYKAALALAPGA
jgi:hypothetical protein